MTKEKAREAGAAGKLHETAPHLFDRGDATKGIRSRKHAEKHYKGAEAVVTKGRLLDRDVVYKDRIKKNYRVQELDGRLRRERTRAEARLLHKAKVAGVLCPVVLEVEEFRLTMSFVDGDRPHMNSKEARFAGVMLANLHAADIIHGDFTPANLIQEHKKMYVIDFGLGFFSSDIEDKAIDVYTMLKAIDEKGGKAFVEGYRTQNPKHKTILKRVEDVKKRVRYA
jgi:Kae1-associated kinase Bud32